MKYHKEKSRDEDYYMKSTLYFEIHNNGGWSNWSSNVLEIAKNRKEAIKRKMEILRDDDGLYYTLNTHTKSLKPAYVVNPNNNTQSIL
jgi:protoporphyrinogen oxidase